MSHLETIAGHRAKRLHQSCQALADDITAHCLPDHQDDLKLRLVALLRDATTSSRIHLGLPVEAEKAVR